MKARTVPPLELFGGIVHSIGHLETMLLIDVSKAMTSNLLGGLVDRDGIPRFHDQPSNTYLVDHLVYDCPT